MKKSILTFVGLLALSLGANAQLRVLSNGHVQLGDWTLNSALPSFPTSQQSSANGIVVGGNVQVSDTTTTISIMGPTKSNYSGGSIAFGGRKDVVIEEESFTTGTLRPYGSLTFTGLGGIKYVDSNGTIFSHTPSRTTSSAGTFTFTTDVVAPKFTTSSDARYKKNVESLESKGDLLRDLTPVSYYLELPVIGSDGVARKVPVDTSTAQRSFGFIAQEVREIFPDLVYEDEEGMLSLDYQGFIPLLVDAYKALSAKVADQEKTIAALSDTGAGRKVKGAASVSDIDAEESVVLMQNRPNPFKDVTEIRCYLPESVSDAFICIYDLNGRQQMRLNISDRGDVAVTVSGSSLPAGIYIYTLITDGQEADTKRMILTE